MQDPCDYFWICFRLLNHVNGKYAIFNCLALGCHKIPFPEKENSEGNHWMYDANIGWKCLSYSTVKKWGDNFQVETGTQDAAWFERSWMVSTPEIVGNVHSLILAILANQSV